MSKSSGNRGQYQKVMPITSKNIGKDYTKAGVNAPKDKGATGSAAARRRRQMEKKNVAV